MKWLKIFWIRLNWVLFGKKKYSEVVREVKEVKGNIPQKPKRKFKYNGRRNYASTKGTKKRL